MSSLVKFLIKLAFGILQSQVIAVVNQQLDNVESNVRARMNSYIQEVLGGMWRGDGANRFVSEITEDAIPNLGRMTENVRTTVRNIEVSRDTLIDADQRVKSSVGRVVSAFDAI